MAFATTRLRLQSLAAGGEAVGRAEDGRVVFVDGGAPGDLVEVVLHEDRPRFARGRIAALLEPGVDRVTPPCALATRCGGCPWQVVAEPAQRAAKQAIVERALFRLGVSVEPLRAAPASLGYRGRATMHARGGVVGFYARRSHDLVAIDTCPALEPALDEALRAARAVLPLGDEGVLRGTVARGAVQLSVEPGRGVDRGALEAAATRLVDDGRVAGVRVHGDGRTTTHGAALLDAGEGAPFWVSADGFRQANAAQNDRLRAIVREHLQAGGARVLELYAGDGNFTRDLAAAAEVLAIEEDADAVARLRRSLPRVEARAERVERALGRLGVRRFDRVLLDPPRAGAKEAMAPVARLAAARVVYVSCDPATLARDAEVLRDAGYRPVTAIPVDLMPHTDHVEVVLVMAREG